MMAIALITVGTLWSSAALFILSDARTPEQVARHILALPHEQGIPVGV